MAGEVRVSQGARPLVAMMRQMFPELVVRMVLDQAAAHVRLRGGREITRADWDAASEELAAMADESEQEGGGDGACLYCGAVVPGWGDAMGCVCETCAARE